MEICILFGLPEALSRQLIVEWLHFRTVVKLDTAVCQYKFRDKYFKLAYGQLTALTVESHRQVRKFRSLLLWTVSRNVQLDGIRITGGLTDCNDLLDGFLAVSGPAVRWIDSCEAQRGDSSAQRQQILLKVAEACPNTKTLYIQDSKTTALWDESLVILTMKFPQLTSLALFDVHHSTQGLAIALRHCHHLETLRVTSKHTVLPTEIALPSLNSIDTGPCNMTDEVLVAVGERCAKLEWLSIFSSSNYTSASSVTDVGVRAVLQGCPLLRSIDVLFAGELSNELRVEVYQRNSFATLTLSNWRNMSDELAQGLLTVSPKLTALDCGGCFWLTDATLTVCAQHCPLLKCISIKRCHEVTTAGVTALVSKVGCQLSTVNLEDCFRLGDEAVVAIAEHCPRLTQIMCPPSVSAAAVATLKRSCPLRFWVGEL
jgi:hypothetical protein